MAVTVTTQIPNYHPNTDRSSPHYPIQSLYGTSEQERDPFDDLPSAGKPKERVRPVSGKHKPAWNNVTITGRGFSENKFKAMSRPNPQWNKSSEVTPATKQSSRRAPAEQLIDFDGAPKSKKAG